MEDEQTIVEEPIIKEEMSSEGVEEKNTKAIITPELVEEWKRWFLIQKFSLDTVDMYYSFIKRYVGYKVIANQKSVDRFRENHMGSVCSAALKSLFKFLVYKKDFPESLLLIRFEKNKQNRRLPSIISPEEVQQIIDGMDSVKDKLLTQIIYGLALRIEETLKLTWGDFNWSEWLKNREDFGKVSLKHTKRDKFRVLPINSAMMKNLYENHELRREDGIPVGTFVFANVNKLAEMMKNKREDEHLNKEQLDARNRKHFLGLAKQAYRDKLYKVSLAVLGKRISPHVLRHSKAQWLMDNGAPIESLQGLLGHSSISTTQVYAQASVSKIKADMQKFDVPGKEINKQEIKNDQTNN